MMDYKSSRSIHILINMSGNLVELKKIANFSNKITIRQGITHLFLALLQKVCKGPAVGGSESNQT